MPSPIDPEIARFLAALRAEWQRHPPLDTLTPPEARQVAGQIRRRWCEGGPAMAETRELTLETSAGPLRLRIHRPAGLDDGPVPTLLYLHGGGFVFFSLDTHDRLMREYAHAGGFAVAGIDYPLAPEARYPIALDRLVASIAVLRREGAAHGIDATRLAIGGDSAGANLALAACLRLRDAGEPAMFRALLGNYGAFSDIVSDEAEAAHGGAGAILTQAEMAWYFGQYLADPARHDPYAMPLSAPDLAGLPPTLLVVPERDVLAEQSLALAARLADAGVAVETRVYPGATHSFLEAMSISRLARDAIADGAAFVGGRLRA